MDALKWAMAFGFAGIMFEAGRGLMSFVIDMIGIAALERKGK